MKPKFVEFWTEINELAEPLRQIADSIRTFGFTNPVLINQENTIMAGHGRVAAAELIGMDKQAQTAWRADSHSNSQ